jgi:tetratricopeptide (TPR) repeat protein
MSSPSITELEIRKGLGRSYLNTNRLDAALETYACILQDYPQDMESYVILGDCYLAEGNGSTAAKLYTRALKLAPGDTEVARRLALAHAEEAIPNNLAGGPEPEKDNAANPDSVARLLQRMLNQPGPVSETDVARAAEILQSVIRSPHPALTVAQHLHEIDSLLPALLELNIRQARTDGRPDLARALQNLLDNIQFQIADQPGSPLSAVQPVPAALRVLFLAPPGEELPPRLALPAEALSALGHQTTMATEFPREALNEFDVVVAHRPHCDPDLLEGLAACSAAGIPFLLDLDLNFEEMPLNDPGYHALGLGTLARSKAYTAALLLAEKISVPSLSLAASLQAAGYPAQVISDGWSQGNDLWEKPAPHRHTLNLGWVSNPGQIEDLALIRRIIVRVLREFPHTRLVIGGSPQAYQLFDNLPESRRLYLPSVSYEDYPYLLGQVDIFLAPLRNIPFNRAASDRWQVEAGVRRIPWVASPVPAAVAWGAGGLLANDLDEWHAHLRHLIQDSDLRVALGRSGRQQAETREISHLSGEWLALLNSMICKP